MSIGGMSASILFHDNHARGHRWNNLPGKKEKLFLERVLVFNDIFLGNSSF